MIYSLYVYYTTSSIPLWLYAIVTMVVLGLTLDTTTPRIPLWQSIHVCHSNYGSPWTVHFIPPPLGYLYGSVFLYAMVFPAWTVHLIPSPLGYLYGRVSLYAIYSIPGFPYHPYLCYFDVLSQLSLCYSNPQLMGCGRS